MSRLSVTTLAADLWSCAKEPHRPDMVLLLRNMRKYTTKKPKIGSSNPIMNPTIGVLMRIDTVLMPQYTTTNGISGEAKTKITISCNCAP